MSNVESTATPLVTHIIRVSRKSRGSLTVRIVRGLAQSVIPAERKLRIKPAVESDEHLLLVEPSGGFDLINFANSRVWPDTARSRVSNSSWEGRVDVSRANHVQNSNRISAHRQSKVMRQLPFHLGPGHIDGRDAKAGRNASDALLQR